MYATRIGCGFGFFVRHWMLMVLTVVLLAAAGCGGASNSQFGTPQATLQTLKTAGMNKDFDKFVECMSDTALEDMAGQLRVMGAMLQVMGPMGAVMGGNQDPKTKEMISKLDAHVKQHVPADAPAVNMMSMMSSPDGGKAAAREAGKVVTDKKAFVVGFLKLMTDGADKQPFNAFTLGDVKIDGDNATATIKDSTKGQDTTVQLRRTNGLWKIDDFGQMGMGAGSGGPGGGMPGGGMPAGGPGGNRP